VIRASITSFCLGSNVNGLSLNCADRGGDHLPKMSFVELSDTRVSRLHCIIKLAAPTDSSTAPQAMLEDHSSNGTYVDDVRVKQGEPMVLSSGSKVSLVRSVTPWVERCFTFWEGTQRASRCFALKSVHESDCTCRFCAAHLCCNKLALSPEAIQLLSTVASCWPCVACCLMRHRHQHN